LILLTGLFDDFQYFGLQNGESLLDPRVQGNFPLNRQEEVLEMVAGSQPYFLFVNCLETQTPYDTGEGVPPWALDIMQRAGPVFGCKIGNKEKSSATAEEIASLQALQVSALEQVDAKLEDLVANLAKPALVVITGDHGEVFGEHDGLWGHGHPYDEVMEVPLIIGTVE